MSKNSFTNDGYIVEKNLFSEEEINKLKKFIESSSEKKMSQERQEALQEN